MPICKLCQSAEADKTNSHLIPYFLVKNMLKSGEEGKRGTGIGYLISTSDLNVEFERDVSPEKMEEVLGKNYEIPNTNKSDYAVDYIFCTSCERRFSKLESLYNQQIHQKKDNDNIIEIINDTSQNISKLYSIFWISVVWRLTLHPKRKLKIKSENKLRDLLNQVLVENHKELINKINSNDNSLKSSNIYLKTFYNTSKELELISMTFVHPKYKTPFYIQACQYIILYKDTSKWTPTVQSMFGVNIKKDQQFVTKLEDLFFRDIIYAVTALLVNDKLTFLRKFFNNAYKKIFGKMPDSKTLKSFLDEIINTNEPMGVKYSSERVIQIAVRHIKDSLNNKST